MKKQVVFGIGGYDPTKSNDNIVEEIELLDDLEDLTTKAKRQALLDRLGISEEEADLLFGN